MSTLEPMDGFLSQMAQTLFDCAKPVKWLSVAVHTRITPDGSSASQSFELKDSAGITVPGWVPPDRDLDRLYGLARDCRRASKALNSSDWYGMKLQVEVNGRFATDFEYRDHYREGDLSRES